MHAETAHNGGRVPLIFCFLRNQVTINNAAQPTAEARRPGAKGGEGVYSVASNDFISALPPLSQSTKAIRPSIAIFNSNMSLRVGKFTRSRTTPIAIVTLYLMLVRAQWQASRLRLPYVCPACRLVNSQRHYSQPREQARSSNQDDAAVLGASKRPKSVSKPGDVAAILNEVKRLSRPHATSQNVKTDTEDPVEQKSSKTSRQTEKSSAVDTKKRNRSASKSTTAEVLKTSVGSRRKRAEGSAQQSVKQTKKVVTKRRSVLDKLKDVFFDSHQEQVLAFSKNPNAGEQEGASSQWNLVNRVVQGASSDVTVDESGGNSSPGTSRRRRRRGVLIRQLPTRLRVRKIETREIPAPTAAKKCVTQQLAQRKRLRQAHELHGVPGKGLKQVLLESFGVQASSAQDTNQEHQSAPKKRKSKKKQTPASEANAVASEIESVAAAKIDVFRKFQCRIDVVHRLTFPSFERCYTSCPNTILWSGSCALQVSLVP